MRLGLIINASAADTQPDPHRHTHTYTKHGHEALSAHMWVFKEKKRKSFFYRSILENGTNGENLMRIDYRVWVYFLKLSRNIFQNFCVIIYDIKLVSFWFIVAAAKLSVSQPSWLWPSVCRAAVCHD